MYKKEKQLYPEELLDSYINYIYITQSFFKEHNIEYNFTSINTQLCGWILNEEFGTFTWERNNTDVEEKGDDGFVKLKDNPSKYISKENDVENIVKSTSLKMKLIDLDKFNFHNCSRWRRGGIDNYLLDMSNLDQFRTRPYVNNTEIHFKDNCHYQELSEHQKC